MSSKHFRSNADLWDLLLVGALLLLTDAAVFVPPLAGTPLRTVLGFPFALFLPGYALLAALFPRRADAESATLLSTAGSNRLGPAERVGLSVVLSVATVGLTGLALSGAGIGVGLLPVMAAVSGITAVALVAAALRRRRCGATDRYVPSRPTLRLTDDGGPSVSRRTGRVLNVALAASVLLVGIGGAFVLAGPGNDTGGDTELYLLSPTDDGPPVAEAYPANASVDESQTVVVGIENGARQSTAHTVVVEMQRTAVVDGDVVVRNATTVDRFGTTVGPNGTHRQRVSFTPTSPGQRRVVFLRYEGDPPADPSLDSADAAVHLNVDVSGRDATGSVGVDGACHDGQRRPVGLDRPCRLTDQRR